MRAGALAAVSIVAAGLGAAAVLVVGSLAGWIGDDSGVRTVVVPTVADRVRAAHAGRRRRCSATASTRRRSTRTAPQGVVTIYSYFPNGQRAQGSGFIVSDGGPHSDELARRHELRRRRGHGAWRRRGSTSSSTTATGFRARSSAGTSSTTPASSRSTPRITPSHPFRSATRAASSSASRSRRSAARSGRRARSPSASSPPPALDRLAHLRVRRLGRDPDRRADQPRQLGRPAARRPRPRDRDQRADPLRLRERRGRRLRDPDQLGAPFDGAADLDRQGGVRLRRRHDAGRHARRSRAATASERPAAR